MATWDSTHGTEKAQVLCMLQESKFAPYASVAALARTFVEPTGFLAVTRKKEREISQRMACPPRRGVFAFASEHPFTRCYSNAAPCLTQGPS